MLRRLAGRLRARIAGPGAGAPPVGSGDPDLVSISFRKFHAASPSRQAAIDLFKHRWACSFPDPTLSAGEVPAFTVAPQPSQAARAFGGGTGRLDGFKVLELGPLEGGHTYQLEALGADVLAIEGNAEAYLKCLIAKEVLGMRSRFLLGDFVRYLEETDEQFDLIFAAGVLYHMVRPVKLIELICRHSPRSVLWTHYYDPDRCTGFESEFVEHAGLSAPHFSIDYGDRRHGKFWGGLEDRACMLLREDILKAFQAFGHAQAEVLDEVLEHSHGPYFTVLTSR